MLEMTPAELFEYFQENKICESLTRDDVEVMAQFLQEKTLKKGDIISDMGDIGDSMFLLLKEKWRLQQRTVRMKLRLVSKAQEI